jgi:hypothetical protein
MRICLRFQSNGASERQPACSENRLMRKKLYFLRLQRRCGLMVRVLGYRSGIQGSIPGTTKKKVVGLEWGPLSLVSTTEELLDRKVAAPV